jgi:drug/metabolite transporter (DMT)-like permease
MTPDRRGWLVPFLLLALIWGASFLFIKVAVDEMPPLEVALYRTIFGALVLFGMVAVTRARLPRDPKLFGHLFVVALFNHAIPFALFAYGEQYVSSIVAGIWNATTPLATLIVALMMLPEERPTRQRLIGLLIGFLGVLIVLGVWAGIGANSLRGHLMCAAAAACYGIAIPYVRRFVAGRAISGPSLAAVQVSLGAVQLLIATFVISGRPGWPGDWSLKVLLSMLALGGLGTGVAFAFTYRVIRIVGATAVSTVTYLIPVVATALGVAVLHETLSWNEPVGALVVLVGVATAQGYLTRRRRPAKVVSLPGDVPEEVAV